MNETSARPVRGRLATAGTRLGLTCLALLGLLATQASAVEPAAPGTATGTADWRVQRNIRVVSDALQVVFSEHRIDQADRYFSADFVQYSPYAAPGGREELKQWWAGMVYAIPDVTTTTTQILGDNTDVVTFRIVRGTIVHDLPAFGIKGNGQRLEFRVADIFRVRHGKITAHWEVADTGPLVILATPGTN